MKILKENIETIFLPFVQKFLNVKIKQVDVLDAKIQSTIERENDFIRLIHTESDERFILHLEFQTSNEKDMIFRMKEYDAVIQRKHKLEIRHFLIFLSDKPMTMRTELDEKEVFRKFDVINFFAVDFNEMLSSQIPEEIMLAILCDYKGEQPEKIIRLIVQKLIATSRNKTDLQKFIKQLSILSRLRKLEEQTDKTFKDMPINYNIATDYLYNKGKTEGKVEGMIEGKEELLKEIITSMLVKGLSVDQIVEFTKAPNSLVLQIQKSIN